MRILAASLLALTSVACFAQADYAREQRWADEITPAILVGDPVQLALPAGRKFFGIYTPGANAPVGVIIVHGLGVHPDWGLINFLRSQLSEYGYATLSVQMPVLAADARGEQYAPLFPEAAERLSTAAAWLRAKGHRKIAIVSHSLGTRMTNFMLNQTAAPRIDAWVAIGLSGDYVNPATFKAPVLDLYGENDLPAVVDHATTRAVAIRRVRGSAQMRVAGADHFFRDRETALVQAVRLFLDRATR